MCVREQLIAVYVFTVIAQNEFSKKLFLVKKCARNYTQLNTKRLYANTVPLRHDCNTVTHKELIVIDAKNKMY